MEIWRCNVWWMWRMNQNFPTKLWQFLPGRQRNMWSCIILMLFLLTNSRWFFFEQCFQLSSWEQYLLELFDFLEGAHNIWLLSSAAIYKTTSSLGEDQPFVWLVVGHFTCPMISSVPHYCTVQYPLFITCSKNKNIYIMFQ